MDPRLQVRSPQSDPLAHLWATLANLRARVEALERGTPVPTGAGAPSASQGRIGSLYFDTSTQSLYVKYTDSLWKQLT